MTSLVYHFRAYGWHILAKAFFADWPNTVYANEQECELPVVMSQVFKKQFCDVIINLLQNKNNDYSNYFRPNKK